MQAFFSDEQLLHEPRQFMRLGRISAPTDLPSRAGSLQAALAARGIAVQAPPDFGREPLLAVHSADYLDYLEHAYARWQAKRRGSRPGSAAEPVALPERPRRGGRPAALPLAVHRRPDRLLPERPVLPHRPAHLALGAALHAQRGRGGRPRRGARRRGLCAVPPVRPSRPPRPRRRLLLPEQQRGRSPAAAHACPRGGAGRGRAPWRRHAADLLPPRRRHDGVAARRPGRLLPVLQRLCP